MKFITLLLILSFSVHSYAQEMISLEELEFPGLQEFNQKRIDINRNGMKVLGSWAIVNMAAGGAMYFLTEDEVKQFSLMNVMWNAVNLGIAIPSYLKEKKAIATGTGLLQSYHESHASQKAYLLNLGLDIGYITAGGFLVERSRNAKTNQDLLKGFGYSFMVQGLGLLIFDISMTIMHGKNRKNFSKNGSQILLQPTGNGIQLTF